MRKQYRAIREICVAGRTIDVTLKLTSGIHSEKRKQKKNITKEKVQKNNDRIAAKNLARLLNANFQGGDFHLVLTYKEAPSKEQAKKDRAGFIKKLRKQVKDLKYVAVTEWEHTRIHHHLVMSECSIDLIEKLWWDYGYVRVSFLDESGDYTQLAEYLIKETTRTFRLEGSLYKRRYSCSANLIRPVVKREEISMHEMLDTDPEPIKGYYIPKESIRRYEHPVTGIEHLEYIMIAIGEPRKYKKWPRGKAVKAERFKPNYTENQEDFFGLVDF